MTPMVSRRIGSRIEAAVFDKDACLGCGSGNGNGCSGVVTIVKVVVVELVVYPGPMVVLKLDATVLTPARLPQSPKICPI